MPRGFTEDKTWGDAEAATEAEGKVGTDAAVGVEDVDEEEDTDDEEVGGAAPGRRLAMSEALSGMILFGPPRI